MPGFILTRAWRDARDGTEIEFWLATDDGPRKILLTKQASVAFAEASLRDAIATLVADMPGIDVREVALKTFQREPVVGIYASHYKQLLALERKLGERGIRLYEADVKPPERYLMERFITAGVEFDGGKLRPAPQYRPRLRMVSLDIETSAFGDLYSIALEGCGQRQVYMLGETPAEAPAVDFDLEYCATPRRVIEKLNEWFRVHDPDAIIGWSVVQFDLQTLQKNAEKYKVPLLLGREGRPVDWRTHQARDGYVFASIPGRIAIDGIEALRAASWSFPSFSLENVSQALLGEGKEIGSDYDKMAEIERRFREDKPALATYNLKDCELVTRIFEKTRVMDFILERSHVTGLVPDHMGGSIAAFSHQYLPRMHREGYVAPNVGDVPAVASPGGFVMDSRPGLYDSVVVLDFKSLYPSIIRSFLVDPVGLVEGGGEVAALGDSADTVPGMRGAHFSRTRHCLPAITTQLWQGRDAAKREKNDALSTALKLLMNSFVGVLGSTDCRFYHPQLISSVTLRGHELLKLTRELVEKEGYEAIYGDTDSIFIWLRRPHETEEALAIARALVEKINKWWRDRLRRKYKLESYLEIEFDTYYRKFFMPTIRGTELGSKKRYAGLTSDGDIIYRGLEVARSDWTPLAQQFQQGLFARIFRNEPYQDYVREYARKTLAGEHDELLVYRKRLRHRLDEYQVNVPPQVRAARLADDFNKAQGRPLRYQNGGRISYVITTAGPEPLEIQRSPIDYQHYLDKQLQPIADAILLPLHDSFSALTTAQQALF